ncbi:MAG: PorT family protein [Bacteroidota bacterium]|nr:PorT family protein [Bacteroidota bacterium]
MKKFIVISTFLLSILFQKSSAQIQMGIEAGPLWSNMNIKGDGNLIKNTHDYTGIKAGVSITKNWENGVGVESGLYYSKTGFMVRQDFGFDVYNIPISTGLTAIPTFQYMELPVLLNYKIGNEKVKLNLSAGPYAAYAMSGEIQTKAHVIFDFNTGTYDLNMNSSLFNRWEAGLMAKAGIQIPLGRINLNLNGQFQQGLNDLSDEPILDIKTKRYAFGAGAGISLAF